MDGGLDSIIEDDDTSMSSTGSDSSIVRKGKGRPVFATRTSGGPTSSHHQTTPSLPYASFHQPHPSDGSPTAYRSRVVSNSNPGRPSLSRSSSLNPVAFGPFDVFPYLFTNLRRAKYNDVFFGVVFLTSLLAFFSALVGLGFDPSSSSLSASGPFASPLPGSAGGLGGMRRVAVEEQRLAALQAKKQAQRDLLRLVKPIPVPNPKEDEPLFADVLPNRRKKKAEAAAAAAAAAAMLQEAVLAPVVDQTAPVQTVPEGQEGPVAVLPLPAEQRGEVVGEPHQMDAEQHALEHPDHVDEESSVTGIFDGEDEHGHFHHGEGETEHGDVDIDEVRRVRLDARLRT